MTTFISRFGESVAADEVFFAWTSEDLGRMTAALALPTNAVDRHFLLQRIVELSFLRRSQAQMRELSLRVALQHLDELPELIAGLALHHRRRHESAVLDVERRLAKGRPAGQVPPYNPDQAVPGISTMGFLVKLLREQGQEAEAAQVWSRAEKAGYPHMPIARGEHF